MNQHQIDTLLKQGFTRGLAQSMSYNKEELVYRIWIVDNSGSMRKADGHRLVETLHNDIQIVPGSRWEELRECVHYHIRTASLIQAPTCFRLLNRHPKDVYLVVGQASSAARSKQEHDAMQKISRVSPGGGTPLTQHIYDIYGQLVDGVIPKLQANQRVVIVIATDGLPTDDRSVGGKYQQELFVDALRTLEGLPVWVVIRLCTDDEDVVEFYNNLDEQLELSLEVLDDFVGEAQEVYEHNAWLNYTLPLHRCREMGYHHRVFDLIDERTLTKSELQEFIHLLFGQEFMDGSPDPNVDWLGFCNHVQGLLKEERTQYNPIAKRSTPWIDMKQLHRIYGRGGGGASASGDGCQCVIL